MNDTWLFAAGSVAVHFLVQLALLVRVVLRPHRDPASRVAWIVVIFAMPVLGIIAYILLGEVNIGRQRAERLRQAFARLPDPAHAAIVGDGEMQPDIPARYAPLFRVGESISGYPPIGGNRGQLISNPDATIEAIVKDIETAQDHVHLLFYIWLPDNNGCKVARAVIRAASRGVVCRAMADDLGSRLMIGSDHWRRMQEAGVRLVRALPIGNPLPRSLKARVDLRNHRKIVVIDSRVTYCGSQNCADPEFLVKAKYAPWVDAMIRFEGPVARQNQHLFAADWMSHTNEDLNGLLTFPVTETQPGFSAQVVGTGPTVRNSAMPEMFASLIFAARRELVITTPYYVPDDPMQAALCASARRGVATFVVFPEKNDSRVVAAASRSYYSELLAAGVKVFEYVGGLLHTKTLTIDGEMTLIGSANMDRRSFDLNYENNILFFDPELTGEVRRRQRNYIEKSMVVTPDSVADWTLGRRFWNNAIAMLGPVL